MKSISKLTFITLFLVLSSFGFAQNVKYKCMLQLKNYKGEGAYIVVSLVDSKGIYEKTLYIMGDDKQWYNGFKQWNKFNKKKKEKLSGITGASIGAGDRSITTFIIDESKLNKGYKLRFESAVEDGEYHVSDIEIPLTTSALTQKAEGKGYIRYVKLTKTQ